MKISLRVLLLVAIGLFATEAFAGFGLDLVYQQMQVKAEDEDKAQPVEEEEDVKATDFGLHAFFAFGKTNAISLGLFAAQRTFDIDSSVEGMESSESGLVYGPSVRFGLPLKSVMPYLRASYLLGQYKLEMKAETVLGDVESEASYDANGWAAAIGLDVPLGKRFAFFVEYGLGQEEWKFKSGKMRFGEQEIEVEADEEDDEPWKNDYQGFALGLGLRF